MAGLLSPPTPRASRAVLRPPGARVARWVVAVIVAGAIARFALASAIGLGVDESYAAAVGRSLSWSYYDHPPLVFWIAALMERAFGWQRDAVIRLPFIVLFCATTWLLYRLTARSFGERAGLYAAVLATIIPVFGVSGGGWVLPDGPLMLGFVATALCVSHATAEPTKPDALGWWLGAGASTGVALLSKYHAVFLIAGTLLFLSTTRSQRRWLARPEPYVAAAVAFIMALPVLVWNWQHHWASLRFQTGRAGLQHGLHMTSLLQNIAGQSGYLLPWIWIPLVWVSVSAARRGPSDASRWLLVCLGAGPVLVFTLVSLGGSPGLPHWPAPGFLLLLPLAGDALARLEQRGHGRKVTAYLATSAAIVFLLVAFAASQIATGWFSRRVPSLFARGDPSLDAVDWSDVPAGLAAVGPAGQSPMVVAANWIDAAKLGAALPSDAIILCFNDDPRHFQFVIDQRRLVGANALVVLRSGRGAGADESRRRVSAYFRSLDSATTIQIHRGGHEALGLVVYRGTTLLRPYDVADHR